MCSAKDIMWKRSLNSNQTFCADFFFYRLQIINHCFFQYALHAFNNNKITMKTVEFILEFQFLPNQIDDPNSIQRNIYVDQEQIKSDSISVDVLCCDLPQAENKYYIITKFNLQKQFSNYFYEQTEFWRSKPKISKIQKFMVTHQF